jgi:uncharacterized coiled-coil protein SlyX|tara:strand:+ start:447 stop:593 length:147 start_codon:yes stop_codon:yes gene_type:complete
MKKKEQVKVIIGLQSLVLKQRDEMDKDKELIQLLRGKIHKLRCNIKIM